MVVSTRSCSVFCLVITLAGCGKTDSDLYDSSGVDERPTMSHEHLRFPPEGEATEATRQFNRQARESSGFDRSIDAERAARGFMGSIEDTEIRGAAGRVVWRTNAYDFLAEPSPDTAHPSLWAHSRLVARHGLFVVADGIYQVRGYDLSVMSIIRGETGWIVVDTLTNGETAAAALGLVQDRLGERPVSAVIYSHSHADHFGGTDGLLNEAPNDRAQIPIIAPYGFTHEAVTENLIAGPHMARRATLMYGRTLEPGPAGSIGAGLGPGIPKGTISFVRPTEELGQGVTRKTIDGVRFEFVDAGGTEAPSEFMFYLPDWRALFTAEVVTGTFHNVLTMRGAKVRDSLLWSKAIDDVLIRYGSRSDVMFAAHHWPVWGTEDVINRLRAHRDVYRNIHDQTIRQANAGNTIHEVSEVVSKPNVSTEDPSILDFYGSTTHNARAVYQFYFGWWNGVPAEFDPHTPEERAKRFVQTLGGPQQTLAAGKRAFSTGDYRWAAELFNSIVFVDDQDEMATLWLASTYEQLGFQAESGATRNYFLSAANELRTGKRVGSKLMEGAVTFLPNVPTSSLFDSLAARYDPSSHDREPYDLDFVFTDTNEVISVEVGRDVAIPRYGVRAEAPAATVTVSRKVFDGLLLGEHSALGLIITRKLKIKGATGAVDAFFDALEKPPEDFPIVTP
ncbi:MAG: alkyl sulfatase dimerization domain-containing protein [Pseudomonadota bacterium]